MGGEFAVAEDGTDVVPGNCVPAAATDVGSGNGALPSSVSVAKDGTDVVPGNCVPAAGTDVGSGNGALPSAVAVAEDGTDVVPGNCLPAAGTGTVSGICMHAAGTTRHPIIDVLVLVIQATYPLVSTPF